MTVPVAVAVSRTLSPGRGNDRSVDSERVLVNATGVPREVTGTLGITGAGATVFVVAAAGAPGFGTGVAWEEEAGEVGEGSFVSSHAAGEVSSDFAGSAAHWVKPSGRDD